MHRIFFLWHFDLCGYLPAQQEVIEGNKWNKEHQTLARVRHQLELFTQREAKTHQSHRYYSASTSLGVHKRWGNSLHCLAFVLFSVLNFTQAIRPKVLTALFFLNAPLSSILSAITFKQFNSERPHFAL